MNKDLEEIKSIVAIHFGALGFLNPSENEQILKDRDRVLNALNRLEAIDNAKPSEALEELEQNIKDRIILDEDRQLKLCATIKHSLVKAQYDFKTHYNLRCKAFELIILKNVDVKEIRPNATAKAYNSKVPYYRRPLTDDEFKFLKEMVHRLDCEEILFELPKVY